MDDQSVAVGAVWSLSRPEADSREQTPACASPPRPHFAPQTAPGLGHLTASGQDLRPLGRKTFLPSGMVAWLAEAATEKAHAAAQHAAGRAAARELIAEYESERGPLPQSSRERARQFLLETGLLDDPPQRAAG